MKCGKLRGDFVVATQQVRWEGKEASAAAFTATAGQKLYWAQSIRMHQVCAISWCAHELLFRPAAGYCSVSHRPGSTAGFAPIETSAHPV